MGNNHDRKKNSTLSGCMTALKWIPVLFIAAVFIWSYYAYVVELCILAIENNFEKIVYILFYHVISFMFCWSYWSTIFTPVGKVPSNWRIPEADIERLFRAENQEQQNRILEHCARDLPVANRTLVYSVRFCEKCKIVKPDRTHHCSVCGTCVLKMDHHCPWVNNCVNFTNYKFFVLFLGYALLYCLYVALTSLEYFIRFWRGDLNGGMGRFHILFLFFVSLMFAISLVSLFGYHVYLVLMNRTTLEAFRAPIFRNGGPDKNGFNLGKLANFQEVFGDNWTLWFLPMYTSKGSGFQYQMQAQYKSSSYDSMVDSTQPTTSSEGRLRGVQPTDKLITPTNNEANQAAVATNRPSQNYSNHQQQQQNHQMGPLNSAAITTITTDYPPSPQPHPHSHTNHHHHPRLMQPTDVDEACVVVTNAKTTFTNRSHSPLSETVIIDLDKDVGSADHAVHQGHGNGAIVDIAPPLPPRMDA